MARRLQLRWRMLPVIAGQLEHYLSLLTTRQKLTTANMANVDTPGYQTKDVDFQFELLRSNPTQSPDIVEVPGLLTKSDGNNVNLDREARMLSETALRFSLASQMLKSEVRSIRSAIQEGKSS